MVRLAATDSWTWLSLAAPSAAGWSQGAHESTSQRSDEDQKQQVPPPDVGGDTVGDVGLTVGLAVGLAVGTGGLTTSPHQTALPQSLLQLSSDRAQCDPAGAIWSQGAQTSSGQFSDDE